MSTIDRRSTRSPISTWRPPGGAGPGRPIDRDAAERAARDLLAALGADLAARGPARHPAAHGRRPTPSCSRRSRSARRPSPTTSGYDELVVARSIPFHSLCMHHLLPFHGVAHVGYLPGRADHRACRSSARVVELFARDLQVQERLTTQIADWLQDAARAQGRRRRARGRAPVHVAARRAEARREHRDLGAARARPRRPPHPPGVPGPHRRSDP